MMVRGGSAGGEGGGEIAEGDYKKDPKVKH